MKIVVIGGSGLIGSKVVENLGGQGHEAVAASPKTGVNTLTGEGLAQALAGAAVVVDVSNSPSFEDTAVREFFETSTRNLLAAAATAGVRHYVVLSIVGSDRLPEGGYMRAKVAQEKLVAASGLPYSVVHATQFFEFLPGIVDAATDGDTARLAPVLIQPVAADEVAAEVTAVALGAPTNGAVEIAGPEQFRLDELGRSVLAARHDSRSVAGSGGGVAAASRGRVPQALRQLPYRVREPLVGFGRPVPEDRWRNPVAGRGHHVAGIVLPAVHRGGRVTLGRRRPPVGKDASAGAAVSPRPGGQIAPAVRLQRHPPGLGRRPARPDPDEAAHAVAGDLYRARQPEHLLGARAGYAVYPQLHDVRDGVGAAHPR
jgi:uncharacterized protein YbjT (DUF2867 family)